MAKLEEVAKMPPFGKFDERISIIDEEAIVWRYMDLAKFIDLFLKLGSIFRGATYFRIRSKGCRLFRS